MKNDEVGNLKYKMPRKDLTVLWGELILLLIVVALIVGKFSCHYSEPKMILIAEQKGATG